ncbi:MAG TPA: VWA domain-containing protein [Acidobacteriaceae bacterium]|nr:VWA domain-containing protein [Acidobacteriaceae bacterium]
MAGEAPQLVPRSEEERRGASRRSHEIVLNVHVTDAAGQAIRGLQESNFTILDNGEDRPIMMFRQAQPPHVVLLLDAVNGSGASYAAERKAVEKYLGSRNTPLAFPVAIGWLSAAGIDVHAESQDPMVLLNQVRGASGIQTWTNPEQDEGDFVAAPGTIMPSGLHAEERYAGLSDKNRRFVLSVDALTRFALHEQDVPGRIVVVWIGAGWPLLTGPAFRPDTGEMRARFFARLADLSNALRDAQVTLNAVASPGLLRDAGRASGDYAPYLGTVTAPDQASAAHLALPVLATESGGEVLDQEKDMASAIAQCLSGVDTWYSLVFQSRPSTRPDEYRPLQVRVNIPGAVVRTNTGYYAEP